MDMTRERQRSGDWTDLEISEKAFHDVSVELFRQQLKLIVEQKEYASTIKTATRWTAWATCIMAAAMVIQIVLTLWR